MSKKSGSSSAAAKGNAPPPQTKMVSSAALSNSSESSTDCVICCLQTDLFCIGSCDHPICYECGIRMRVVCESNECPICRTGLNSIMVCEATRLSPFLSYDSKRLVSSGGFLRKHNVKFETNKALNAAKDILAHICVVCEPEREFNNFEELKQHMRKEHELFYCDLCVENLKLFSWERKCYNRRDLAQHRRSGDADDRSHRGHPLCEFCDERYMDEEFLYRHLRRDHFYCHFCEANGKNKFYPDAPELKKHLKAVHILCEEGACKDEPLGVAFANDIDFKAHRAQNHGAKHERHLDLNFNVSRRERVDRPRGGPGEQGYQNRNNQKNAPKGRRAAANENLDPVDEQESARPEPVSSFALVNSDFPSLNPTGRSQPSTARRAPDRSLASMVAYPTIGHRAGSLDQEEFPTLSKSKSAKKNAGRIRRNSKSVSPPASAQRRAFVMVDDDESFPSQSEQQKKDQQAKVKQLQQKAAVDEKAKESAKSAAKSKVGVTPWGKSDQEYPALGSGWKPSAMSKSNPFSGAAWANIITSESNTKAKKKKQDEEKKKAALITTDSLLETLPASQPIKSKSRRVAQQKQRQSETSEDDRLATENSTEDNGPRASIREEPVKPPPLLSMPMPPPGFENYRVPPPPGFDQPLRNDNCALKRNGFDDSSSNNATTKTASYTKSNHFVARNRALFDSLSAYMNMDESRIQSFKKASSDFRRREIDAKSYCEIIRSLLNDDGAYARIFEELVCLLPDIELQNQLWKAYKSSSTALSSTIKPCGHCGQLLTKLDYFDHISIAHGTGSRASARAVEAFPPLC